MKYLSLFSGIGGFEKGIQQAYENKTTIQTESTETQRPRRDVSDRNSSMLGSDNVQAPPVCIGFSEIDKYATKVYKHHFPEHKEYGDITKINEKELPDFDLIVGGFPCQSFSIAGKRGGFEDTRGTMFFEIARIIKQKQPRLLLLENVKGLLSHDKGDTFRTIITTLDELGYDTQWQVLNSKNHGVPQNRERVFIIGHLRGTSRPQVFPFRRTATKDKGIFIDESHWRQEGKLRIKDGLCKTLNTAGGGGHNPLTIKPQIRRLTPKECERLQGFPDNWTNVEDMSDTQRYKQCGNAVTVNVIRDIMENLLTNPT
jgi:site-specific DNA-cytosine methylase